MSIKKYKYKATVTLVVQVEGVFEDDENTVLEDQARDKAIDDADLMFRDEDEIQVIFESLNEVIEP